MKYREIAHRRMERERFEDLDDVFNELFEFSCENPELQSDEIVDNIKRNPCEDVYSYTYSDYDYMIVYNPVFETATLFYVINGEPLMEDFLIWNRERGFVRLYEGCGDNLHDEDIEEGYDDYMMVDYLDYEKGEFAVVDGTMVLLNQLYQEKFETCEEVIKYLITVGFLEDVEWIVVGGDE